MTASKQIKARIALLVVITFDAILGLIGCGAGAPSPSSTYPIVRARDLLLDKNPFPEGWEVFPCEPACERREKPFEAARGYGHPGLPSKVIQDVYVFNSVDDAEKIVKLYSSRELSNLSLPNTTELPVTEVEYNSSIADEFISGCGMEDDVPICRVYIRYRNYVVKIFFHLSSAQTSGLHIEDIPPILRAVDTRFAETFKLNSFSSDP